MNESTKQKTNHSKWIKKFVLVIGGFIAIPQAAFAQTAVAEIIGYACSWLSGEIGAAIAVLVVIHSGYEMLSGESDKKKLATRCIAIGLIIGGAYIATDVFHIGGF